jgi:putative glutamine amidotransferase
VASNASSPLIGLTTYVEPARHGVWDEVSALVPMSYVSAVIRSGGTPVLLPESPSEPANVLAAVDALVLIGGPDVDPALYDAEPHPSTDRPRPGRDAWEVGLARAGLELGQPLLAICRGVQVLNVALGGTLHQHLPDVISSDAHRVEPGEMTSNTFVVEPGTQVAEILGREPNGMCHHHQALDRLGQGLRAVGFATDGTVEAVEVAGQAFAVGVQWHPEDTPGDDRLFKALVDAAVVYRQHKTTGQG